MKIAFVLIVIHFIADFICQSDEMAQGKSKSNYWLTMHVIMYTLALWMGLGLWYLFFESLPNFSTFFTFLIANFALHWVTDYFTSKVNSRLWDKKMVHWFFVSVGFDQVIHYACLFGTYTYFNLPQ